MVNHVRTLLLNMRSAQYIGPGEEYVPPDYVPINLPQTYAKARLALFGQNTDRVGINLILARILNYVNTTAFTADITRNDTRISYDPENITNVWAEIGPSYTTITGSDPVAWDGDASFLQPGRAHGLWRVVNDGAGNYTLTVNDGAVYTGTTTTITLGEKIPLVGSRLSVVVPAATPGTWDVELLIPPDYSFAQAAYHEPGEGLFDSAASEAESNWYAAWSDVTNPAPLRAAALALALAERLHELHELRNI